MTRTADLVFPLPLTQVFTYRVPDSLAGRAQRGSRATAPLGKKTLTGFLVAVREEAPAAGRPLKDLLDILDEEPAFTESMLGFTEALSRYYHASWGMFLQAALPPSRTPRRKARVRLTDAGRGALAGGRLGPKEKTVANLLAAGNYTPLYLARRARVREIGPLLGRMAKKGYLLVGEEEARPVRRRERRARRELRQLEFGFPGLSRSAEAAARLEKALVDGRFAPFYLYGGRAAREEVNLRLLRQVISGGGKALLLVPEISLTESRAERFARLLGRDMVRLHSRLSPREREEAWDSLRNGSAAAALGPRSALFAPLEPLRLVIVDEEQDESHVQTENPVYDARRGARLRAEAENAALVYGSERPSLERYEEASRDGWLVELEREPRRARVMIADDRGERGLIGRPLLERLRRTVERKEPALLFLNRRGYASFLMCSSCRSIPRCPSCRTALPYFRADEKLVCRTCGAAAPPPAACPACGGRYFAKRGAGVEAVAEEVRRLFSGLAVATYDTASVRGHEEGEALLERFKKGRIGVLVGTMLLARREELPPVRLVGVISPETALGLPNYRAGQRVYETVSQMLGFLADDERAEGVVQTSAPEHHSLRAAVAGDYELFYRQELELRRAMNYPPFTHLAEVRLEGRELRPLAAKSRELVRRWREFGPALEVWGPALAPRGRGPGFVRVQIVLRSEDRSLLDEALRAGLASVRLPDVSVMLSD